MWAGESEYSVPSSSPGHLPPAPGPVARVAGPGCADQHEPIGLTDAYTSYLRGP